MIVSKIGGSSLGDKKCFLKVKEVIKSDEKRRAIVVSAPGKRFSDDEKITDLFLACYKKSVRGEGFGKEFLKIENRFSEISEGLPCFEKVREELLLIKSALYKNTYEDFIISRGEYLSGIIAACLLNFTFIDPTLFLFFDERGKIREEKSKDALQQLYKKYPHMVIPGFYGLDFDGRIKTFPRGGSDITGSLVSAFLNAEKYENMTDVSGLFLAPPKIYPNIEKIKLVSLENLKILSSFSNGVFNEGAVDILIKYNVPLEIKSTFSDERGTFSLRCAEGADTISGMGIKVALNKTMLILIAGEKIKDGLFISFLLNSVCSESTEILSAECSKYGQGLILNVPFKDFKRTFGILYKIAEKFKEADL